MAKMSVIMALSW